MKFAFVEANYSNLSARKMCQLLEVTWSGYKAWQKRPESNRKKYDRELLIQIHRLHRESGGIYGSPKIHQDLKELGHRIGRKRVERIM